MTKKDRLQSSVWISAILMMAVAGMAWGDVATSTSNGLTAAGGPLAIHGYDPVTYFDGGPKRGLAAHSKLWNGAVYRFVDKNNLKKFSKNPEKYAPRFGGFCAYGVSVGKKFDGDPEVYRMVKGQLYFNLNPDIKATWEKDLTENIGKAEKNWRSIRTKAAASL